MINQFYIDYIKAIENPDRVGWNGKVWIAPQYKGYDKNQRGYGIDIVKNDSAKRLTQNRPGQWLTEGEADKLMKEHLLYVYGAAQKHIEGFDNLSDKRKAALLGMLYRGDSVNKNKHIININEPDDNKFFESISSYYKSKGLNSRAKNSSNFFSQYQTNFLIPMKWELWKPSMKFKEGGLIRKMLTAAGGPLFPWQLNIEWVNDWKFRTTPASRSKVLSGKGVETDKQYTERRKKETTKRTWRSDAADIAHGIGEGVLALHPYTAIPYYGAKVGQDVLNGNVSWLTALNVSIPLFHLAPQAVGLREATNVALEDAANAGSKTARNLRVAREIKLATKNTKLNNNSTVIPHEDLFDFWHGGLESDFDFGNLDVFRKASKQSKRNRNYAGFYMYGTPRLLSAFNYGFGEAHGIKLKPRAKKLKVNFNTERIEALELLNYKNQGYDYIEGKDVWGAPEYILLNKDAIQHTGFFDHSLGHNIHILRDRNVPKIDLSINNLPSKTSLKFFERKPAKISEAERAGVPKGERNVKQGYLLKDAIEEANKFAEKWGYDKLSQNATLLDIENLYNQHNTFFRGVTTEQLENTRNRVAKELGINPELLTNDLYLLYVSTHPWPGNDRIWVTPFSHYGKIYGNSDMIGGKGLLSAVMRPWKTTKDIKQWPKLSLWTLGFKEDVSNPVITPWVSNAPDAIRSLGALSEFLVKSPLIYRGLGKDFKGTFLLHLKYNDNQGKLGWIESLIGELPLEIIIEKQGGKMNAINQFKNGGQIRKMQTAAGGPIHYSRTMTTDNLSKAANYVGNYILKGLGAFGKIMAAPLTGGPLGPATVVLPKTKKLLDAERKITEIQELLIGKASTWVSPLNYGAALATGNGLNARKGEEEVASWSPAWQAVGRLGELYVGPKAVKGVKSAPRVVVNTAAKAGVKPAKAAVVAREIKLGIKLNAKNGRIEVTEDYFNSPDKWYRITETPEKYGIMELGKNVTTHDAPLTLGTINGWRSSILNAKVTKGTEGFIKKPPRIELNVRRKNGQAHGNTSQAAKGKLWGGTTSGSRLFPEGIIEGQAPSMINYGIDRTNFVITPWELVPNGGRVGFHTGEMPMSNLGWFLKTNKGTYTYEPIIPEKRITYLPILLLEPSTSLAFFERKPAKNNIVGASLDYSMKDSKGMDFIKQFFALLKINGKEYTLEGLKDAKNVQQGLPEYIQSYLNLNTVERAVRAMRKNGYSEREIQLYIDKVNEEMNKVKVGMYSDLEYNAAGALDFGGFYNNESNFISVNKDAHLKDSKFTPEYIMKHEGRHLIDYNTSMTDDVINTLEKAYDKDFLEIPKHEDAGSLKDYQHMDRERVTTNRDARDALLTSKGKYLLNKHDFIIDSSKRGYSTDMIDFLNKIIKYVLPEDIVNAVENSNGYGKRYINYLKKNNKLTPTKIEQLRLAMIQVPSYLLPITGGYTLYNLFNQPQLQYLKQGGKMNILEFLKNGSGIHIKPKNRGKFTKYCHGKVTNECILKGKNSSNPAIRKRATFADNARHFKHRSGGKIDFYNLGGWFKNTFNNVGSFLGSDAGKSVLSIGSGLLGLGKGISNSGKIVDLANAAKEAVNERREVDKRTQLNQHFLNILNEELLNPIIEVNGSPIHTNGVDISNRAYNKAINTFSFDDSKYNQEIQLIDLLAQQALGENSSSMIGSVGGLIDSIGGIAGSLLNKKSTAPKTSLIITGNPNSSKQVITTNSGMSGTVDDWRKAIMG